MHLVHDSMQKSGERRSTGFNINYRTSEIYLDQRMKERRSSPFAIQLLRARQSVDSSINDGNHISRQQQRQRPVQTVRTEVTYCIQRITNV